MYSFEIRCPATCPSLPKTTHCTHIVLEMSLQCSSLDGKWSPNPENNSGDINSSTVLLWTCSIPTFSCKPWMKYSVKLCWLRNFKAKHLLLSSATPAVTYSIRNSVQVKPVWWLLAEYMVVEISLSVSEHEFPRGMILQCCFRQIHFNKTLFHGT